MSNISTQNNLTCTKCGYLLDGLNLRDNCPECGTRIVNGCFWCEYDLSNTAPDSVCPECGIPVTASIGHGVLESVPIQTLRRVHSGMRTITLLILVYIVTSISATIAAAFFIASMNSASVYTMVIVGSTINNGILIAIAYGWIKASTPLPNIPSNIDAQDKRTFLSVMSWLFIGFTALIMILNFIPSGQNSLNAAPGVLDFVLGILNIIVFMIMLIYYIASVMYIGWIARLVRNTKMYRRSKHLVWSGPLIAILGFFLLLLGPLIVLILYWNMIEYTRRDLKKIINAADRNRLAGI